MTEERRENDKEMLVMLTEIKGDCKTLVTGQADHEVRIRGLEKTSNTRTGAIAVIAGAFSAAGVFLGLR